MYQKSQGRTYHFVTVLCFHRNASVVGIAKDHMRILIKWLDTVLTISQGNSSLQEQPNQYKSHTIILYTQVSGSIFKLCELVTLTSILDGLYRRIDEWRSRSIWVQIYDIHSHVLSSMVVHQSTAYTSAVASLALRNIHYTYQASPSLTRTLPFVASCAFLLI
jgi:hypothetical protein